MLYCRFMNYSYNIYTIVTQQQSYSHKIGDVWTMSSATETEFIQRAENQKVSLKQSFNFLNTGPQENMCVYWIIFSTLTYNFLLQIRHSFL